MDNTRTDTPRLTAEPWPDGDQWTISVDGQQQFYAAVELAPLLCQLLVGWYAADPDRGFAPIGGEQARALAQATSDATRGSAGRHADGVLRLVEWDDDACWAIVCDDEPLCYYDPRKVGEVARQLIDAYNAATHACVLACRTDEGWTCVQCGDPITLT